MTLVSSCRPCRAMNTRLGSLIQISSTSGSSRKRWSGPKPETRATSSPITPTGSGTGMTTPVRLRSSWARTTSSAIRRTRVMSSCGSTPSRRTTERTCWSRSATRSTDGLPETSTDMGRFYPSITELKTRSSASVDKFVTHVSEETVSSADLDFPPTTPSMRTLRDSRGVVPSCPSCGISHFPACLAANAARKHRLLISSATQMVHVTHLHSASYEAH